jgi:hypothetical protein
MGAPPSPRSSRLRWDIYIALYQGMDLSMPQKQQKYVRALAPEGSFSGGRRGFAVIPNERFLLAGVEFQPPHNTAVLFLEINPRGEAAFKSCLNNTSGCPTLAASLFLRLGWDATILPPALSS